jgi:hypothetical protein
MRCFIFLICLAAAWQASAGDIKYPVKSIPEALLRNAHVVKRMEEIEFRIISTGETVFKKKYAITILNENGDEHAGFSEFYDKLHQITSIEGALYDAMGNQLKKLKNKDVQDLSASDDNNLMDDNRRKAHDFMYRSYPYTVEYEVVQKFNNTLFFPSWVPQEDEHYAVEQSSYTIVCPQDYTVRWRAFNYKGEPSSATDKNSKILQWKINHLGAIIYPYASPSWKDLTTVVYFAPAEFEIQGYKGNMSTWKDFGKFQSTLNQGRDVLPAEIVQAVQQVTNGLTDPREKVKLLYQYLQKNTRYISIQLGLGGWQPFEAAYVAKKGYGDCKALTNYMYSLLKAAGIRSNYVLVYAGQNKDVVIEDFPVNRFNHVILCVPMQKDSIWLECTSQTNPAGYMGDFTGNRKALLINEDGGVVVSTPRYHLKENIQRRAIKARLTEDGTLHVETQTTYSGLQQDRLSSMIDQLSKEEVKKILNRQIDLGTYEITDFSYRQEKGLLPEVKEDLKIVVPNYASVSGKRIFINPNILNRGGARLTLDAERKVDYVFDEAWKDEDITEIELPAGYQIEAPLQDLNLKNAFGSYSMTVKLEGNKLIYKRMREQYLGRFPAGEGKALVKFMEDIYKADHSKMVLVK